MTPCIASRLPAALFSLCLLALPCAAPADEADPPLVPRAVSLQALPGRLSLAGEARFVPRDAQSGQVLAQFARLAGDALPESALGAAGPGAIVELKIMPGLDVPAEGNETLQNNSRVTECRRSLAAHQIKRDGKAARIVDDTNSLAAAAAARLDQQRKSDVRGRCRQRLVALVFPIIAGNSGNAVLLSNPARLEL